MIDTIARPVTEESQVGEARRIAVALAAELGFNETDRGKVAIVTTEAAKNLVNHAREGELLLQTLKTAAGYSIEIVALDRGPGMANVGQCLRDGFSTAGTPGTGLGAIKRLSTFFDIHSVPKQGTALLMRLERPRIAGKLRKTAITWNLGSSTCPKQESKFAGIPGRRKIIGTKT